MQATNNKEIIELLKLNDNKKILWVDNTLKLTLKTVIDNILRNYMGLPLSWEDIYYEFLYLCPKLIEEYQSTSDITLKTWLGIRCKFFVLNKCREYTRGSNKVMNNYVSYSRNEVIEKRLADSKDISIKIDVSSLNDFEFQIYEDHFMNGMSVKEIEEKTNQTRYKVKKTIDAVKAKLINQVKN